MCEKKVTSTWNSLNQKFIREKGKSSLKFKAKNWDFGREEWNNYHCKFVLLCKLELLTDQWRKKKILLENCVTEGKRNMEKRKKRDS